MAALSKIVAAAGLGLAIAASASAANINTTTGGFVDVAAPIGSPQTATIGQTFTPDSTQTNLYGFTLYLRGPAPYGSLTGNPMTFRAYLAEWDETNALVGAILYTSADTVMPASGTQTAFAFPASVVLTPGSTYIAFITILDLPAQDDSAFGMPYTSDVLASGQGVYSDASTFADLFVSGWYTGDFADYDMFFKATFRDPQAAPAPAAVGVFGLGLLGLGAVLRRRA